MFLIVYTSLWVVCVLISCVGARTVPAVVSSGVRTSVSHPALMQGQHLYVCGI